jgi:hypothetical protein
MTDTSFQLIDMTIAVMAVVLALMFWLRATKRFKSYFVGLSLLVALLAVTYFLELTSNDLSSKLFWNAFEYISITIIPLLYLIIVVKYAGRDDLLTKRNILLASIIPIISLVMLWTNQFHSLFYESTFLVPDPMQPFSSVDGPFYYLNAIYSFGLEFAAIGTVTIAFIKSSKVQRAQVGLMVISAIVPTAIIMLSLANLIPLQVTDAIMIGFLMDGIVLYLAVYHFGVFYATPLVLNSIAD